MCGSTTRRTRPGSSAPVTTAGGSRALSRADSRTATRSGRDVPAPHQPRRRPYLHLHVLWLNRVKTISDGKWRAVDSRQLHRVRGAGSAIGAPGAGDRPGSAARVRWVYRPKSHGPRDQGLLGQGDPTRSRRGGLRSPRHCSGMAEEYEEQYGREPSRRAVCEHEPARAPAHPEGQEREASTAASSWRDWEHGEPRG